jgi:hypothetical protein
MREGNTDILGNLVTDFLENSKNRPTYLEIFQNWEQVVGTDIANVIRPYRVVNSGAQRILVLQSNKGLSTELMHESQNILNTIHKFLNETCFSQLKIIQNDA